MDGNSTMNEANIVRIEGKIDVLNERQQNMSRSTDNLHERLNTHSARISKLEERDTLEKGERNGVSSVVRVLWAILAVLLTGGLATVIAVASALDKINL